MIGFRSGVALAALTLMCVVSGCGANSSRRYNYSPSVIESGEVRQLWWCANAVNPTNPSQDTDAILYKSINLKTNVTFGPVTVLAETVGGWDSVYTCNPKVTKGVFANPLGDGKTYQYVMYYVGTDNGGGQQNSIGAAFSNDGIVWNKYPHPVIQSTAPQNKYGVGQPAVYNSNGKAAIRMFYECDDPIEHHVEATSTDGLHFTVVGTLTTAGLDPNLSLPSWGDMAYDSATGYWYALFNLPTRDPSTTGEVIERGQLGVELYRIPASSLLTGTTPWEELHTFDTNLTNSESNFIAGFVRDQFGSLNVKGYPNIRMYASVSNPPVAWNASPEEAAETASPETWIVAPLQWTANQPLLALNRYVNSMTHVVTTGWMNPVGQFRLESTLGHLYEGPQQGATVPFYACKQGSTDYFVSLDYLCEGQRFVGKNGYGYSHPIAGLHLVPLYRCRTNKDHFVSKDARCEGAITEELLGYALP